MAGLFREIIRIDIQDKCGACFIIFIWWDQYQNSIPYYGGQVFSSSLEC